MKKTLVLTGGLLAAALTLSGCAGGSSTDPMPGMNHGTSGSSIPGSPAASADMFNDADATFAQMMIPHHTQAVEMSDIMLQKTDIDSRITALATQIKAAQAPEIKSLSGWLTSWGQPQTMSGSGHGMDGMMSADDLSRLKQVTGTQASRLFLTQMIAHHQGAVAMAGTEVTGGKYPDAVAMAKAIVTSQNKEIEEMNGLLATL
ncbi:DUF305 domain-containing protein [Pseudarthrobacter sp. N5]|uniref:DUF305 domain-containing protein n=1 Tax=Pseudarthrobacter sp. N5 TaxID=3418416 RepID=UPI003CF7FAA3